MLQAFNRAAGAEELGDVTLCRFRLEAYFLGCCKVVLAGEFGRKRFVKLLLDGALLAGNVRTEVTGLKERLEDIDGVLDENIGDSQRRIEIFVGANQFREEITVLHHTEGSEYHCDPESNEAEAADRWNDVVTEYLV